MREYIVNAANIVAETSVTAGFKLIPRLADYVVKTVQLRRSDYLDLVRVFRAMAVEAKSDADELRDPTLPSAAKMSAPKV